MLTPEQLDRYPEALIQLWAEVELDIIVDIARRILKTNFLTPTAKWQHEKLLQMRPIRGYVLQRLSALTKKTHAELKQIFEDAAVKTVESDNEIYEAAGITPKVLEDSPALKTVVEEGLKQTEGLYKNLTGTIADTVTKQFEDALDHAYLQVVSGAFTPQQAIRGAVKALAAAGMQSITYPSGHRDHMDVAIRRATLTGINQTCARVQLRHSEEMGCDLVQVTSHLGARPTHAVWQGGIFSRSGKHPKYPDFVSTTGYGTGAGLCGWNCHHNFFPFFEGISVDSYKRYDVEENNRVYAQSQKQRAFERKIRKDKRECAAFDETGQKDDFNRSAAKLKKHEEELNEFLKTTNLYRRRDREQVLEFGRSQSNKAVWAAKKSLNGGGKNGIIKPGRDSVKNSIHYPVERKHTGIGNPNAILQFDVTLNKRQTRLLERLPSFNSQIIVPKSTANMKDLAALTAATGAEFAVFTKGGIRFIVRGNATRVDVTPAMAKKLAEQGYKWSGHTHPGIDDMSLFSSEGDRKILSCFRQEYSVIVNSKGKFNIFGKE